MYPASPPVSKLLSGSRREKSYERCARAAGENSGGRAGDAIENLKCWRNAAKERLTGRNFHYAGNLDMGTCNRNLGTIEIEKVSLPKTQIGNDLLLDQLTLVVVQVQFDFARNLGDGEDGRGRSHHIDDA